MRFLLEKSSVVNLEHLEEEILFLQIVEKLRQQFILISLACNKNSRKNITDWCDEGK